MKLFKIAALTLLALMIVLFIISIIQLSPVSADSPSVDFVVTEGERSAQIAEKLESNKLIKNGFVFYVYLKLTRGKVLPGTYELSATDSATDIAYQISTGKFKVTKVTIIEGWRASQMETYFIDEKKLVSLTGFGDLAEQYEGYLFPDTYEVKVDIIPTEMIELMRTTFDQKTSQLKITPETVILASIVERESQSDSDRAPVAGVYANRIKQGMLLQADPTVQYAKGSWATITLSDYSSVISDYNTYLHEGWPPGPISSPGLKSLEAAVNPEVHDYLFFFHAKGQTFFSKTYAEHSAKVREHF